jgi:hypothetical protein
VTIAIEAAVEVLEISKVRREQSFYDLRIDHFERPKPRNYARQKDDEQVPRIAEHSRVLERSDLVKRSGQAHYPFPVKVPFSVDIAFR